MTMQNLDNGWGFYCDIESEEVISQKQELPRLEPLRLDELQRLDDSQRLEQLLRLQQESQRLELPILHKKQQQQHLEKQESCLQEATQHIAAICVMTAVILFL